MALRIKRNVPLSTLTTFRIGGMAKFFVEARNKEELLQAISFAEKKRIPIFVIGGGSDVLLSDRGYNGLVLRYKGNKLRFKEKEGKVLVTAEAGLAWDELVREAVKRDLQGIECLSGIPGSVGASPIQNIGAYGQELKDTFLRLVAYDLKQKEFVILLKPDCKFSYRESIFKKPVNKGRYIITEITLKLKKGGLPTLSYQSLIDFLKKKNILRPSLQQVRDAVLSLRSQKLDDPKVFGNAGSFFKNPIVDEKTIKKLLQLYPDIPYFVSKNGGYKLFAGWLIDKAGWRGKRVGGAMVSKTNALVLINPEGRASAKDIIQLSKKIKEDVKRKFGVKLEPEVQFIGFD